MSDDHSQRVESQGPGPDPSDQRSNRPKEDPSDEREAIASLRRQVEVLMKQRVEPPPADLAGKLEAAHENLSSDEQLKAYVGLPIFQRNLYANLSFLQAMSVFPRQPLLFAVLAIGLLVGRLFDLIEAAHAASATFVPPLGLSQGIFTGIVVGCACIVSILILGLFWAGYIAKPKNYGAAAAVQHLVTFLSGAVLGLKI